MFCTKCGTVMEDDLEFCPTCGASYAYEECCAEILPKESGVQLSDLTAEQNSNEETTNEDVRIKRSISLWKMDSNAQKRNKAGRMIMAVALILLASIGIVTSLKLRGMIVKYGTIWDVNITEEDVKHAADEAAQAAAAADELERELAAVQQSRHMLENAVNLPHQEEGQKDIILGIYQRNMEIVSEAKSLIMESFGYEIDYEFQTESEDAGKVWRDEVIDSMAGNTIVGEAVKGGLDAAQDGLSMQGVIEGAGKGIKEGIPSFVADQVKGFLSEKTGGLSDAASVIGELLTGDNAPEGLAQAMLIERSQYIDKLQQFVLSEKTMPGDIAYAAENYYRMQQITEQITSALRDEMNGLGDADQGYQTLCLLAKEYQSNNTYLLLYAGENTHEDEK